MAKVKQKRAILLDNKSLSLQSASSSTKLIRKRRRREKKRGGGHRNIWFYFEVLMVERKTTHQQEGRVAGAGASSSNIKLYWYVLIILMFYAFLTFMRLSTHLHSRNQQANMRVIRSLDDPYDIFFLTPNEKKSIAKKDEKQKSNNVNAEAKRKSEKNSERRQKEKRAEIVGNHISTKAKFSYCVVVSNLEFVDGALVLAWSLHKQSLFVKEGKAELTALVSDTINHTNVAERLSQGGTLWHSVIFVTDLQQLAPRALRGMTYNKLYLFQLYQFDLVAYFDVDMLFFKNPDAIFGQAGKQIMKADGAAIGALGNNPHTKKPYFQTGVMLIHPSHGAFNRMLGDFLHQKEYQSPNGRDGILIRRYFRDRYVRLDHYLSLHLSPEDPLGHTIGFHFRGTWKPWFNKKDVLSKEKPEIGEAYEKWWENYEELHEQLYVKTEEKREDWDPSVELWLMRGTKQSYTQRTAAEELKRKRATVKELPHGYLNVVSEANEDCHGACARSSQNVCEDKWLGSWYANDCKTLDASFHTSSMTSNSSGCDRCSIAWSRNPAVPGFKTDKSSSRCLVNHLFFSWQMPSCVAKDEKIKRFCVCVPPGTTLEPHSNGPMEREVRQLDDSDDEGSQGTDEEERKNKRVERQKEEGGGGGQQRDKEERWREVKTACASLRSLTLLEHLNTNNNTSDGDGSRGKRSNLKRRGRGRSVSASLRLMKSSLYAGRTIKLMLDVQFLHDGEKSAGSERRQQQQKVSAIVKMPQLDFPFESYMEVVSFAVDRLLGFHRVPPTHFFWLGLDVLHNVTTGAHFLVEQEEGDQSSSRGAPLIPLIPIISAVKEQIFDFLRDHPEMQLREKVGGRSAAVGVSAQLWIDGLIVPRLPVVRATSTKGNPRHHKDYYLPFTVQNNKEREALLNFIPFSTQRRARRCCGMMKALQLYCLSTASWWCLTTSLAMMIDCRHGIPSERHIEW